MNIQEMSNVSKQMLIILKFIDKEFVNKIPRELIEYFKRLAIDSNIKFKYEKDKDLEEQDLLEETKDLLAVIFYSYIADEKEKEQILKSWNDNENTYNEVMLKEYNLKFNVMEESTDVKEEKSLVINKNKGNLYKKIKNMINRIFKK